jgi:photosynthetic reaction center H subunit
MGTAFTSYIDFAQVTLYAFWIFFFGLIWWLRKEDRREGYPLEKDVPRSPPRALSTKFDIFLPSPKTFALPDGGTYTAPNFERDQREIKAERTAPSWGSPLTPTGNPMLSGVGPASWAERHDVPEKTFDGRDAVVPLRVATDYSHFAGHDPRGWKVTGCDGEVAGTCVDIWVDRSELMVRYLEVELDDAKGNRLIPAPMFKLSGPREIVHVSAITAEQFADVPALKADGSITTLEEERVGAYYAGGRMYATPKRIGPVV